MAMPSTAYETRKVIAKKKPSESPRCDEIPVEIIKYAPETIYEQIAEICYSMAETVDTPTETHGILKPLPKRNKPKGLKCIIDFIDDSC